MHISETLAKQYIFTECILFIVNVLTVAATKASIKSMSSYFLHIVVSGSMEKVTFIFVVSIFLVHALLFHDIGTVH